jgi:hypothetical protein
MKKILLLLAVAMIASGSVGATPTKGKHRHGKHGHHSSTGMMHSSTGMMH